jgi:aerobic C4-dicarboxylate transport protein
MARPLYKNLTVQVLTAIAAGALIGAVSPSWGAALAPLGEGFVRLVKMVVGPIIFLTIVGGIGGLGDLKKVGRVGLKALIYFEVVTTLALGIGLVVGNVVKPGSQIHAEVKQVAPAGGDAGAAAGAGKPDSTAAEAGSPSNSATQGGEAKSDESQVEEYTQKAKKQSTKDFLLNVIPESVVGAFAQGDLLQILFFSVLFGAALAGLGESGKSLRAGLEWLMVVMFRVVAIIMKVAPLGAFGAMAGTVGKFGLKALAPLMTLMGCVYLTMAAFIFIGLWMVARLFGFSLWRYLVFIKEEILLVLGTSSSESALPRMIEKLERLGCGRGVVGLVIPAGYSFNLDGTSIYLSMAVLFIAQAYGVHMSVVQQLEVMGLLMLTSKGAAAVTGGGFVTLAATLSATHVLPVEGLALVLGVDRFMSEARAITNLIGNGVATIAVSRMERDFDDAKFRAATGPDAKTNAAAS